MIDDMIAMLFLQKCCYIHDSLTIFLVILPDAKKNQEAGCKHLCDCALQPAYRDGRTVCTLRFGE